MRICPKCSKRVSGDCGHVELRVANPKELYRHYRRSNGEHCPRALEAAQLPLEGGRHRRAALRKKRKIQT